MRLMRPPGGAHGHFNDWRKVMEDVFWVVLCLVYTGNKLSPRR